jgi:hypothetical protein
MGQNDKIGESSYFKITTELSQKEKLQMHYEAVSRDEIKANKKQEQRLFIYQVILVIILITLAYVKEKYFPSHIDWIERIIKKI